MEEAAKFANWVTDKFSDNGRADVKKKSGAFRYKLTF